MSEHRVGGGHSSAVTWGERVFWLVLVAIVAVFASGLGGYFQAAVARAMAPVQQSQPAVSQPVDQQPAPVAQTPQTCVLVPPVTPGAPQSCVLINNKPTSQQSDDRDREQELARELVRVMLGT